MYVCMSCGTLNHTRKLLTRAAHSSCGPGAELEKLTILEYLRFIQLLDQRGGSFTSGLCIEGAVMELVALGHVKSAVVHRLRSLGIELCGLQS